MTRPRARDAGIWFGELPTGPTNAMTDVPGVLVGHHTIIKGSGKLVPGQGPIRTGVTAIRPHAGNLNARPVKGSYFDFNGSGGLQGALQVREFGLIDSPIVLTNTMSMGAASDAVIKWMLRIDNDIGITSDTIIPVVSECDDSWLNDSRGMHVREEHVFAALDGAGSAVHEGAVGAGTGMSCYDYKGGIGTSSRVVAAAGGTYTLGALTLCNHGEFSELRIDGVPVGSLLGSPRQRRPEKGSIVLVVGTDAPLDSRQLNRIARRAFLGLGVTGASSHNGSGDIALAFSTANQVDRYKQKGLVESHLVQDRDIDPLFRGTVDCVAEAITNALFGAETMEGRDGHVSEALPIDETLSLMESHGRLSKRH